MKILRKLRALFRRQKLDGEMTEEIRTHLELQAAENVKRGMNAANARYAALREFGGVEQIKERVRDKRRTIGFEHAKQDLRHALRQIRKQPGFTAIVILTLALSIGANTAIFSLLDEVALKPLAAGNPEELVLFEWRAGVQFNGLGGGPSAPDPITGERVGTGFNRFAFERFAREQPTRDGLAAFLPATIDATVDGQSEKISAQFVSRDYFEVMRVPPQLGRTLGERDDRSDAPPAVVISHRYWSRRFGGASSVLGKTFRTNDSMMTIVGVMPPSFHGALGRGRTSDLFLPMASTREIASAGDSWNLRVIGRLAPGATARDVRLRFATAFRAAVLEAMESHPRMEYWLRSRGFPALEIRSGARGFIQEDPGSLFTLQGLAALLLVIACSNVANLLLARGAARQREIAVRLALGASRRRIIQQLLTENGLLTFLGAGFGVLFAAWGKDWLLALHPLFREAQIFVPHLDGRVLGFTLLVAAVTTVGFGLTPALRAARLDLNASFQGGTRGPHGSKAEFRLGRALMAVQIALSLVLLIGTGLFARTLRNLQVAEVGFNREHLILFRVEPAASGYSPAQCGPLYTRIAAQLESISGVSAVAFSDFAVLTGGNAFLDRITVPGYVPPLGETPAEAAIQRFRVSPRFFETFQMPIIRGRGLRAGDDRSAAGVAVIDQTLARKYFGAEDPIGRHLTGGSRPGAPPIEIVGLVRDTKSIGLRQRPPPTLYQPVAQNDSMPGQMHFVVRTTGDPSGLIAALRQAVREIAPDVPLVNLRTQDEAVERLVRQERFFAHFSIGFSALGLGLVGVGLYGLMSYSVFRRRAEIGLRMALGALPSGVVGLILRESLRVIFAGVAMGVAAAVVLTRLIAGVLYGLSSVDPATYAGMIFLLVAIAALACLLPARRASKVDPMVALRAE